MEEQSATIGRMPVGAEEMLPALRVDLDLQPSPVDEQPGLLIRDCYRYSDTTLIIPPFLLRFLQFFDGNHTRADLIREAEHCAGLENAIRLEEHLRGTLEAAGFLRGPSFQHLKEQALAAFRQSPVREASHAGAAYPNSEVALREYFDENLRNYRRVPDSPPQAPLGVAAPHISFEGGWQCYAAAVDAIASADPDSLFVVLGTSHYGEPDHIGLTAKPFSTPFGITRPDPELVETLARACPETAIIEDYSHAIDHSIEFHILLLQYALKPDVRVLPVLVGSFFDAMHGDRLPSESPQHQKVFTALRQLADEQGKKLVWLMSVDMAHMGRRYGDKFAARAYVDKMAEVEQYDRTRIEMLRNGDSQSFWRDVNRWDGELKWCGSSTLYTFTQVYPEARASLLTYQQWNIDAESVVSFGTLRFERDGESPGS
jgi:AmmeMemoRadiSam system protein B